MFEYEFYRGLTNFHHHLVRANVEAMPDTIQCRKYFYKAEQTNLDGSPLTALRIYATPVQFEGGKLDPLTAWRDVVLLENKEFRRDTFIQETSAEIQIRYVLVWNRYEGRKIKEDLVKAAPLLPLVPRFNPETFRPPIVQGPFDGTDKEGFPLIEPQQKNIVLERMGLRKQIQAPPPGRPAESQDPNTRPLDPRPKGAP